MSRKQHIAPAIVMVGTSALIVWAAWEYGRWVLFGAGATVVVFWGWIRLETGAWIQTFDDVEFRLRPGNHAETDREASRGLLPTAVLLLIIFSVAFVLDHFGV